MRPKACGHYDPPLAISAHGIRTHGHWQKTFAEVLSGSPTKIAAYDYDRYGLFHFLVPALNHRKIDEFHDWYLEKINDHSAKVDLNLYNRRPCLVAHSFGTWITCNAMLKFEDIRFDKIVLCGSILPRDFNWAKLFARDQVGLVRNERGLRDPWPSWASHLPGMGTSGSNGFDWFDAVIEEKIYDEHGHNEFLDKKHIEEYWVPFFQRTPSPLNLLHGRSIRDRQKFSDTLDCTGDIDKEVFGLKYQPVEVPLSLALDWIKINPDIYTFLIDRASRRPVGYINAMPVDDSLYARIRGGTVTDNEIPPSGIVAYTRDQEIKIYLMSIAVSEDHRQWGQGLWNLGYVQLIGGFLDKLINYRKHCSIRVTHLLATAWTDEGLQMCKSLGMTPVGNDKSGFAVYEVELAKLPADGKGLVPALRRLLRVYRDPQR
jgi:pimeloyl-ACP methyl ester carboxylesterase